MSRPHESDRNQEATVYLGNLDERCTDALVWELMLQAGPVVNVHLPKDRISQAHQGFGFCEFLTEEDAEYACRIMNQIKLYGKPVRVNKASYDKKQLDVGANLFIGNLDPVVDERVLYDTFSAFGIVSQTAKIARDPTTGESKGYGFISYHDFESADAAIESMNNQYLANKAITVQFAFKKDQNGERHGTPAERLLAHEAKKNNALPTGMMGGPPPMGGPGRGPPMMGNMGPGGLGSGANGTSMGYSPYPPNMSAPPPPPPAGFQNNAYPPPGMGMGMGMPQQGYPPPQQQMYSQPPPPPPPGFAQQYSVPPPGFGAPGFGGGGGAYPPPPPPPPPPIHMG